MGPEYEIWSHFADSGLILFLKGEMLKPINWKNGVSCPTAAPPIVTLLAHYDFLLFACFSAIYFILVAFFYYFS